MAAPSSSTPKRAASSRPVRRFTLDQANRALPLVRRIVTDIVRTHASAAEFRDLLDRAAGAREQQAIQRDMDRAVDRLAELIDELADIGVELKDYENGLVDFIGKHEGRDVYLCWKLGEERITRWHELTAGFAGRKPVSLLHEH